MKIPSPEHYKLEEAKWMKQYSQSVNGNDSDTSSRNETITDFLSRKREILNGLTTEQFFNIYYYNQFVVPALRNQSFPLEHWDWLSLKVEDISKRGLRGLLIY